MERQGIRLTGALLAAGMATISLGNALEKSVGTGFEWIDIPQGFALVSNPFSSGSNRVQNLFNDVPDRFDVIKIVDGMWQTNRYSAESDSWSMPEMTLTPGEGVLVSSPQSFTWNVIGKPITGILQNFIPAGRSLRSSILPLNGLLSTDLGFPAVEGMRVSSVDLEGKFSVLATFQNGSWTPEEPVLSVGASLFVEAPSPIVWDKRFVLPDDNNPLQISAHPQDTSLNAGESLRLSVSATGAMNLQYQWQKNGNDIPHANEDHYEISSTKLADAGSYSVVVFTPTYSIRSEQSRVEVIGSDPVSPTSSITFLGRLSQDGSNFEIVISGESGQRVNVEAKRNDLSGRWRRRATGLEIGENGQAIHSERVAIGQILFFRVVPQIDEIDN